MAWSLVIYVLQDQRLSIHSNRFLSNGSNGLSHLLSSMSSRKLLALVVHTLYTRGKYVCIGFIG